MNVANFLVKNHFQIINATCVAAISQSIAGGYCLAKMENIAKQEDHARWYQWGSAVLVGVAAAGGLVASSPYHLKNRVALYSAAALSPLLTIHVCTVKELLLDNEPKVAFFHIFKRDDSFDKFLNITLAIGVLGLTFNNIPYKLIAKQCRLI